MDFRNADAPRAMYRVVREDAAGTWFYAGSSSWTRDRQRARTYRTKSHAERLAKMHADGGSLPHVETV